MSCLQTGEPQEEEILWLRHSQFLSRDAQFDLDFVEQIGIVVEVSRQPLPRIQATKKAERDDGNEVEMQRPKISPKTLGLLDIDPCQGND